MRILILTALFIMGFIYFKPSEEKVTRTIAQDDSIKLKSAAPDRAERILTVAKAPAPVADEAIESESDSNEAIEETVAPARESDLEEVEEVAWSDLDEAWNGELKELLGRLEPADSESIHKSYLSEVEGYKAEMDALLNEKTQKTGEEAISEVDQLISQLDQKHEDKLKEIFGAHYEAVRDHYNDYMQSNPEDE